MKRLVPVLFVSIALACGGGGRDRAADATIVPETHDNAVTVLAALGTDGDRLALTSEELLIAAFDDSEGWVLAVPKAGGPARELARVPRVIKGLETDGTQVWVATWGGILRIPRSGGPPERVGEREKTHALARSDTHLAWLARDGVWVQALPDGAPVHLHDTLVTQGSVGLHGEDVIWADHQGLFRMPLSGGSPVRLAEHAGPAPGARMWVHQGQVLVDMSVGGPTLVPLDGGEKTPACAGVRDHRRGMFATDQGVFWASHEVHLGAVDNRRDSREWHRYTPGRQVAGTAGGVYFCAWGAVSGTENLAPDTTDVLDIVADDTHVYWVDKWTGAVARTPIGAR